MCSFNRSDSRKEVLWVLRRSSQDGVSLEASAPEQFADVVDAGVDRGLVGGDEHPLADQSLDLHVCHMTPYRKRDSLWGRGRGRSGGGVVGERDGGKKRRWSQGEGVESGEEMGGMG